MNASTTIQYEKFDLLVEWTGEKPEPETGFRGSFEIEKVTMQKQKGNATTYFDVTDFVQEFDLWREIEDKVDGEAFIETMKDHQEGLFEQMRDIFHPENE